MTWLLKFPSFTTTELREGADEDKTITLKSCHCGFKIEFYKLEMCYVRTLQFYVQTVNTGNKVLFQCLQHMYVTGAGAEMDLQMYKIMLKIKSKSQIVM